LPEAIACACLKAIPALPGLIDYEDAGFSRGELEAWLADHQRVDAEMFTTMLAEAA